jgi:DNA repair and recombination protein RAD52
MFTANQKEQLTAHLDGHRVKTRQQDNLTLSYLEGYDIIDTANRIFGYDGWSYRIVSLEQISEEVNTNQNHVIGYRAIVEVSVHHPDTQARITREDVGYGTGIARQFAAAHESAGKEAATDGLKRALRTFGNQFGNALYDKSQKQVDRATTATPATRPVPATANHDPYATLRQLGLDVVEQNGQQIVTGSTYGKQQHIKPLGFRWDASRKVWYMPLQEAA